MITIACLNKPVSIEERNDFIIKYNHELGFQIEEDDNSIRALDYTEDERFEEAKQLKLEELDEKACKYDHFKCDEVDMYIISSVGGIKVNADIRSQTNMQGLISTLADDTTTVDYKCFDNTFSKLTKPQLQRLHKECILNGQKLYQQKWTYQTKIANAKSQAELDALDIQFKMTDFTSTN